MFTVSQVRRRVYERKFDHDEAKELHAQGWPLADIARKYGVTPGAVRRITGPRNGSVHSDTAAHRFMAKVEMTDSCWIWRAYVDRDGYGVVRDGKTRGAHRVSYELFVGEIPEGLCVLHTCDNPSCVRPDHLWLGTNLENVRDAVRKNRHTAGERNGNAKLSANDVAEIRRLRHVEGLFYSEIASRFGVSTTSVRYAVTGRRYAGVQTTGKREGSPLPGSALALDEGRH